MPAGHLGYNLRRRLIGDAFLGDIPRRRLRGALNNDALYALVDRAAGVVLVHLLAPHAGELGLRGHLRDLRGSVYPTITTSCSCTALNLSHSRVRLPE